MAQHTSISGTDRISASATSSAVAEALYNAAARGKLAIVRQLLRGKAHPDSKVSKRGAPQSTALLAATLRGKSAVVQTLIRHAGASVIEPNGHGLTPLLAAITKRNLAITNILLEAKAPVNALSTNGQTPLMAAAALAAAGNAFHETTLGSAETAASKSSLPGTAAGADSRARTNDVATLQDIVEALILAKADVNQRSASGRTALVSALDCGLGQTTQRPDSGPSTIEGTVRRLLEANAQPLEKSTATLLSKSSGQCSSVCTTPAPIWIASSRGDWRVVQLLLKAKADPDGSKYGQVFPQLLPGAVRTRKARTALFEVVKASCPPIDTMQMLLEAKASLNVVDANGRTPLMEAVRIGRSVAVQKLLRRLRDYNPARRRLQHFLLFNQRQHRGISSPWTLRIIAEFAWQAPAEVNYRNQQDLLSTPLMHARNAKVARMLVQHGAYPLLRDDTARSALDRASETAAKRFQPNVTAQSRLCKFLHSCSVCPTCPCTSAHTSATGNNRARHSSTLGTRLPCSSLGEVVFQMKSTVATMRGLQRRRTQAAQTATDSNTPQLRLGSDRVAPRSTKRPDANTPISSKTSPGSEGTPVSVQDHGNCLVWMLRMKASLEELSPKERSIVVRAAQTSNVKDVLSEHLRRFHAAANCGGSRRRSHSTPDGNRKRSRREKNDNKGAGFFFKNYFQ